MSRSKRSFSFVLLLFLLTAASRLAAAEDYNIYIGPENSYYGQAWSTPQGYDFVIVPPTAFLWSAPRYPDEGAWERRQQQDFHPRYESWSDYYASPPWHQEYDLRRNFHPYWMR